MDYKSLKTLEYHKIIEKLSSYAGSPWEPSSVKEDWVCQSSFPC